MEWKLHIHILWYISQLMKYYLDKFRASHYVHRVTHACYQCVGILQRTSCEHDRNSVSLHLMWSESNFVSITNKTHFLSVPLLCCVFALKTYDLHRKYLHCYHAGYVFEDERCIFILNARTQDAGTWIILTMNILNILEL